MTYAFDDFVLDFDALELRRSGVVVPTEPQVFDVLAHLVRNRDRVVPKEELLDTVWGDRFVSESALTSRIRDARRAVGDDGSRQHVIRTVHGRGYRFVADRTEHVGSVHGLAPVTTALVERDDELRAMRELLDRAIASGHGSVVLVSGEAGVGKSSLCAELCREAAARATVLTGRCDDLLTPRAMGPLRDVAATFGGVLAGAVDSGDHDKVVEATFALLREGPSVLVVEDMHWADDATIDLVRVVGRRISAVPALLVLTYRDDEIDPTGAFRRALGSFTSEFTRRIELAPLSCDGVRVLAADSAVDADALHEITRGNPFFVSEVLAGGSGAVPATVRDAVLARVARLGDGTRAFLGVLSVVPARVSRALAARLADHASECLAEAERRGVLNGNADEVWFRHELARRAVETSMTAAERVDAHRRVLEVLLDDRPAEASRIVHHADGAGDVDRLVEWAPRAMADAARLGAHGEAALLGELVLAREGALSAAVEAHVATVAAYSLYLLNRFEDSYSMSARAVAAGERAQDARLLSDALGVFSRAAFWARGSHAATEAAVQAVELLRELDDRPRLALAMAEVARVRSNLGTLGVVAEPSAGALEAAESALALAEELGRPDLVSQALTYRGSSRLALGDTNGWRDLDRATALVGDDSRIELVVRAYVNWSGSALRAGRLEEALAHVDRGLACAADGEFFAGEYRLELTRQSALLASGRWAEAEVGLRELLGRRGDPGNMRPLAQVLLAQLLARTGRLGEAESTLRPAVERASVSDEVLLVGPVAEAAVETAWLAGDRVPAIAAHALALAHRRRHRLTLGAVTRRLQRAGEAVPGVPDAPGPWGAATTGDPRAAAAGFDRLCERYEAAVELTCAGDAAGLRRLRDIGATAVVARLQR